MVCFFLYTFSQVLNYCAEADGDLVCQPGVRWEDVNLALREKGISMFFPVCNLNAMGLSTSLTKLF